MKRVKATQRRLLGVCRLRRVFRTDDDWRPIISEATALGKECAVHTGENVFIYFNYIQRQAKIENVIHLSQFSV